MGLRELVVGGIVVGLGVAAPNVATAKPPPRCAIKGATTVAHAGTSKLLQREFGGDDIYGPESRIYVCSTGHRPVALGGTYGAGDEPTISLVAFTRRYVAFATTINSVTCGKYMPADPACLSNAVVSYDRRSGKSRRRSPEAVTALAVTTSGWLAWATQPDAVGAVSVRVADSAGIRTVAAGPIDPGSLRAAEDVVTWSVAGVAQTLALS